MSTSSEDLSKLTAEQRLERNPLSELYAKFRVHYYREVFVEEDHENEFNLTAVYKIK